MSKFTPGKWMVDGAGVSVFDEREEATLFIVDNVYSWVNRDAEAEANARLIAAAPEMYELLSYFSTLEDVTNEEFYNFFAAVNDTRKLLARIGGEE